MQGKRGGDCAGEDEADKEPCRRAGADPGPFTGVLGLRKARRPPVPYSTQAVPGRRLAFPAGRCDVCVCARAEPFVQDGRWDVSERHLSVTLGGRRFFFSAAWVPPRCQLLGRAGTGTSGLGFYRSRCKNKKKNRSEIPPVPTPQRGRCLELAVSRRN